MTNDGEEFLHSLDPDTPTSPAARPATMVTLSWLDRAFSETAPSTGSSVLTVCVVGVALSSTVVCPAALLVG